MPESVYANGFQTVQRGILLIRVLYGRISQRACADAVLGSVEKIAAALDAVFGSNLSSAVSGWRDSVGSLADRAVSRVGNGTYQEKIPNLIYFNKFLL